MRINSVSLGNTYNKQNFKGTIRFKDANNNLTGEQVIENGKTKSTTEYFYDNNNNLERKLAKEYDNNYLKKSTESLFDKDGTLLLVINNDYIPLANQTNVVKTIKDYSNLEDIEVSEELI